MPKFVCVLRRYERRYLGPESIAITFDTLIAISREHFEITHVNEFVPFDSVIFSAIPCISSAGKICMFEASLRWVQFRTDRGPGTVKDDSRHWFDSCDIRSQSETVSQAEPPTSPA